MKREKLHTLLEAAFRDHHSHHNRARDPVALVHRYQSPEDQEVAAFLVALLAYGNVRMIMANSEKVLRSLGPSPAETVRRSIFPAALLPFRHRFTTGEDLEILFHWLHRALGSHGSLENYFLNGSDPKRPMRELLSNFVVRLTSGALPQTVEPKRLRRQRQLKYLVSDPQRGSACKRLNMFLRWMIRPADGIDLGLWRRISPSSLVLPLDTHLLQTLRALKWTQSRQASWRLAEAATLRLREFCPEDPIRYDFALCHLSMAGKKILHYTQGGANLE